MDFCHFRLDFWLIEGGYVQSLGQATLSLWTKGFFSVHWFTRQLIIFSRGHLTRVKLKITVRHRKSCSGPWERDNNFTLFVARKKERKQTSKRLSRSWSWLHRQRSFKITSVRKNIRDLVHNAAKTRLSSCSRTSTTFLRIEKRSL